MKFILAANTMGHSGFAPFVRSAVAKHPDAALIVCGDLINVFPEPGEDLLGSIFYEIYGDMLPAELERLRHNHFRDVGESSLVGPLRELFDANGRTYHRGLELASRRYARVFADLADALGGHPLYYIPGNMDYPSLSSLFAASWGNFTQLDGDVVSVSGLSLAGVGGIPHSAQPFCGVTTISPYEMSEQAYERHLASVWGADVLISHLSPHECPALESFVRESPLRMLICRSPFSLDEVGSCRGMSQCDFLGGKMVVKVRPFDYPENFAFTVDISADPMSEPILEIYAWHAAATEPAPGPHVAHI